VEVAEYHLRNLRDLLAENPGEVTVPVQAHFEGALLSFIAASDQTAEAIRLALGLRLRNANLRMVLDSVPRGGSWREDLVRWHDDPLAEDVRRLRRLMAHHHYDKSPATGRLEVQRPPEGTGYHDSRELVAYCTATVDHARGLAALLLGLRRALRAERG
jgi:hypothetical protein